MGRQVVVVGGGAREHAIVLKLCDSKHVTRIYAMPGNPGTKNTEPGLVELIDIQPGDVDGIVKWCREHKPDLVVVGPEEPLSKGLSDRLNKIGVPCFGPSKAAAKIETDKAWSKEFMTNHDIPTARYKTFTNPKKAKEYVKKECNYKNGFVIKASGLAAGKGVVIPQDKEAAYAVIDDMMVKGVYGDAGKTIVIEEFIVGEECSVMAFTDGRYVAMMPAAQDYKAVEDGDKGPNTGGMGAVCPLDLFQEDVDLRNEIYETIIGRCIDAMANAGIYFVGVLFAGVMITSDRQLRVLEFNCRFGDPETQSVLPLVQTDIYEVFEACVKGTLDKCEVYWRTDIFTCGVVLADAGYPENVTKGQLIEGLPQIATAPKAYSNPCEGAVYVMHGGTKLDEDNRLVTNGGRIVTLVGCSRRGFDKARRHALGTLSCIKISKSRHRTDIGWRPIARHRALSSRRSLSPPDFGSDDDEDERQRRALREAEKTAELTYKDCGVDIEKGKRFVDFVKTATATTTTPGVMSGIGSFGALYDVAKTGLKDPVLVSGADGVGTKLKTAIQCKYYDSVGIDLVAMCVNDVLVHGAKPLFFLDYYACGSLRPEVAEQVLGSIVKGCKQADCALIGGETAEMPGMYHRDDIDLAGFAVGAVERDRMLPRVGDMKAGDVLIGLSSTGVHSNGFSMIRRLLLCFDLPGSELAELLLRPTQIYVKQLLPVIEAGLVKAAAHITGGGLLENIPRCLPEHLCAHLDARKWTIPSIIAWLANRACPFSVTGVNEMMRTFNCGLGMVCVVDRADKDRVMRMLGEARATDDWQPAHVFEVGELVAKTDERPERCVVDWAVSAFEGAYEAAARDIPLPPRFRGRRIRFKDRVRSKRLSQYRLHHGLDLVHPRPPRDDSGSSDDDYGRRRRHSRHLPSPADDLSCLHGQCEHEAHRPGASDARSPHRSPQRSPHRHHHHHHHHHHHQHHSAQIVRKHRGGDHMSDHHSAAQLSAEDAIDAALDAAVGDSCGFRRVAIMLSGTGTNAYALMDFQRRLGPQKSGYKVVLLVSNKADAPGLRCSEYFGVESRVVSHKDFPDRVSFDMRVHEILNEFDVELVCLAGFMRILSEDFVKLWSGKIVNIHPSLLPAFKGLNAYQQAIDAGVQLTGCTVHFVAAGVDEGAIIMQDYIEVEPDDDVDALARRGKRVENEVYPVALQLVAKGRIRYNPATNRVVRQ